MQVVQTLVEKREEIHVTKWDGGAENACELLKLWPDARGFTLMTHAALTIHFENPRKDLVLQRGVYVQVQDNFYGDLEAIGLMEHAEVRAKWQPKTGGWE